MSDRIAFDGKTAVITGAGSGIGAALAAGLAERGCHLALADVNKAGLTATAKTVARPDRRITATLVDVANPDAITNFRNHVAEEHGEAHLLFNNAGVAVGGDFERIAERDFAWLMDINFWGVVNMTRAFLPMMRQGGFGHITNISSLFGLIAPAGQTAYCSSKFAVRGFTDALRHELAGSPIGATTVHPGGVNTSIARNARLPEDSTREEAELGLKQSERLLVMPPPRAAEIILRAVERRKRRVLVGQDAHMAAFIERLFPARYWSLIGGRLNKNS